MHRRLIQFLALTQFCFSAFTYAGGLFGDAINLVAPGVGTELDRAHKRIKDNVRIYKEIEEGSSEFVRKQFTAACAIPFQTLTNAVIARCSNYDGRTEDQNLIQSAIHTLIQSRVIGAEEFSGIQIRWCPHLDGAEGMAPDRGRIYLDPSLKNDTFSTTSVLAHEIVHVRQYRQLGTDRFKCKYSMEYTNCGGCQDSRNGFEREAYAFQSQVEQYLDPYRYQINQSALPASMPNPYANANSYIVIANRTGEPFSFWLSSPSVSRTYLILQPGQSQVYNGGSNDTFYNIEVYTDHRFPNGVLQRTDAYGYGLDQGGHYFLQRNQFGNVDVFRDGYAPSVTRGGRGFR